MTSVKGTKAAQSLSYELIYQAIYILHTYVSTIYRYIYLPYVYTLYMSIIQLKPTTASPLISELMEQGKGERERDNQSRFQPKPVQRKI